MRRLKNLATFDFCRYGGVYGQHHRIGVDAPQPPAGLRCGEEREVRTSEKIWSPVSSKQTTSVRGAAGLYGGATSVSRGSLDGECTLETAMGCRCPGGGRVQSIVLWVWLKRHKAEGEVSPTEGMSLQTVVKGRECVWRSSPTPESSNLKYPRGSRSTWATPGQALHYGHAYLVVTKAG